MNNLVSELMFNYEGMGPDGVAKHARDLPNKIIRWLASNHPDNKTRKIFFELTNVTLGEGVVIGPHLFVSDDFLPLLTVGDRVAIAPYVTIVCSTGPNNSELVSVPYVKENLIKKEPVQINADAWIGTRAVILPGVTIGNGAIIGAGAVVTRDVEPRSVVAGVPARPIRNIGEAS